MWCSFRPPPTPDLLKSSAEVMKRVRPPAASVILQKDSKHKKLVFWLSSKVWVRLLRVIPALWTGCSSLCGSYTSTSTSLKLWFYTRVWHVLYSHRHVTWVGCQRNANILFVSKKKRKVQTNTENWTLQLRAVDPSQLIMINRVFLYIPGTQTWAGILSSSSALKKSNVFPVCVEKIGNNK